MKPRLQEPPKMDDMFRNRLDNIIDMKHELVVMSGLIDWDYLQDVFGRYFSENGRPAIPTRMMVGLHILKHVKGLSDEEVCETWRENPYFQYFCGESYFQHDFPIERSSMTHWRHRVGDELKILLDESLMVAFKSKALRGKDIEKVAVDTTVQEKAVTFPTDSKLHRKAIVELGKIAKQEGIELRQSYARVSKTALMMYGRYSHAKQKKRAKKQFRKLHTWLGRVIRDIRRKAGDDLSDKLLEALAKASRIYHQKREDSDKLLSWHAPEVECIGKGKAHKPYEFGCKVSITTNVNPAPGGHFVLHAEALHGRPYDGHTLKRVMDALHESTGIQTKKVYVDKGYRGHDYPNKLHVFKSGQKRGVTDQIKRELKRRSVIEPVIGHVKNDGHLGRNYLKGTLGDRTNAVLSAAGYNFRQLLNWLRKFFDLFFEERFFVIRPLIPLLIILIN